MTTYRGVIQEQKKKRIEPLRYTFIDNSILLTTKTIERNGFREIWRQTNSEYSIQILCFNPDINEFKAFDRYHWLDEPFDVSYGLPRGDVLQRRFMDSYKIAFYGGMGGRTYYIRSLYFGDIGGGLI